MWFIDIYIYVCACVCMYGKIMNACNNNHVLREHQLMIGMFRLLLRLSPAAMRKAPLLRYMLAVFFELILFSHLLLLTCYIFAERATMRHILLAETEFRILAPSKRYCQPWL